MNTPAIGATTAALELFAREPGRSAFVVVHAGADTWSGGVAEGEPRPAASLLKLPVAMAAEGLLPDGATRVADLLAVNDEPSVLNLLDPGRELSAGEVVRLAIGASDGPCARWLWQWAGGAGVEAVLAEAGCPATTLDAAEDGRFRRGVTSAADAVQLLGAADDPVRFPHTSAALRSSIRNSRIPLGAVGADVAIAHKTGTLRGVANDVAVLRCDRGEVWVAFLSEDQHDTLVTGYEMGICTRTILEAWGLSVRSTMSAAAGA